MATRSGRPMLNDGDDGYTQRTMAMTVRCRNLHDTCEAWVAEHGATMTTEQRMGYLAAVGCWNGFMRERNWDRRQGWLHRAFDAYLEFEASINERGGRGS